MRVTYVHRFFRHLAACGFAVILASAQVALAQDDAASDSNAVEAASGKADKPLPSLDLENLNNDGEATDGRATPPVRSPIRTTPIPRKPTSAAEMLEYFEVDESLLRQFIDQRPLHDDEREAVTRILFALPKLPSEFLAKWTEQSPDWDAIIQAPEDYRTKIYELSGQVKRVEKIELIPEAAQRFEFTHYYQATIELGDDRWTATVCSRRIPLTWKVGQPIDEAVSFRGMLLKIGDGPVFATKRIAWHPNKLNEEQGITRSQVYLGDLGMDVGLWDDVRDRRPLGSDDREGFYQLLSAVGRSKQEHVRQRSTWRWDFADVLRHPDDFHGRLLSLEGSARRCTKIVVNDPDIRARLGIEHYYEIYVLVSLEKKIVYRDDETGKTVEFQTFPVVVCAKELPPGMPQGDDIYEAVAISGVFFKLWAYQSGKMTAFDPSQRQLCPMIVALRPDFIEREQYNPYIGITIGGLFIIAVLGV